MPFSGSQAFVLYEEKSLHGQTKRGGHRGREPRLLSTRHDRRLRYHAGAFSRCSRALARCALLILVAWAPQSQAGYGVYAHGYGIKSLGYAGLAYTLAEDSYTLAQNPAGASAMGDRLDFGLDLELVLPEARIRDNLFGADDNYHSEANLFPIPQIGGVKVLSDRLSIGTTAFFAGFGSDYRRSPYERFGGDPRITLRLAQIGVSGALSYMVAPGQALGIATHLSYQQLDVKGAGVFASMSQDPQHFSNQGKDGVPGIGFTVSWMGTLASSLTGGVGYRSRTWSGRFKDYAGLLPDRGRLDLPQQFGGGLSWEFVPRWLIAGEFQRVFYSSETATGNRFSGNPFGPPLGSKKGPGFGWDSQNVYRLGLAHQVSEVLILRAGYIYGTQIKQPSQNLLGALAPLVGRRNYTLGATWRWSADWEVSGYTGMGPKGSIRGEGSIPLLLGDGEIDQECAQYFAGIAFARHFGR